MSPSPESPPPYVDPERQRLLGPGSSYNAIYSTVNLPPDDPRPNKRTRRSSEQVREPLPQADQQQSRSRHPRRSRSSSSARSSKPAFPIWATIFLVFLAGFIGFHFGQPSESERNDIRARWEAERRNHSNEVEKWYKDRDARRAQEDEEIEQFKKEEEELIVKKREMIADYNQKERELLTKKRKMVNDFMLEEERWLQKMDTYKIKEKDLIRRQEEMEDMYRAKEEAWRQRIAGFEKEWQHKIDEENRKRERARLYWDDIQGDQHCLANGRKKYTARLANLNPSLDGMEACKVTPITLNGVTYDHPISCENTGSSRGIRGHWIADNEGVCAAYWEFVRAKDCTAPKSGFRRIEAKLGVVHAGENPETLCLSTPLYINGQMFSRPKACPDWGKYGFWGIWNIPDDQCQ